MPIKLPESNAMETTWSIWSIINIQHENRYLYNTVSNVNVIKTLWFVDSPPPHPQMYSYRIVHLDMASNGVMSAVRGNLANITADFD